MLRFFMFRKWLCFILSLCLLPLPQAHAAVMVMDLPVPGAMVNLSPAYQPAIIKGITVHQDNPFLFDFLVDVGQDNMRGDALKQEGEKLIKYFLATLAIPEKDLWVNLSPYEKDRTVPEALGQTDMGRDLLAQDYILKQLTASLIYPEKELGKKFWDRIYQQTQAKYGSVNIPVNTFNKVWIMADKAEVFEHGQTALVTGSHLKVMLEEDYLATKKHAAGGTEAVSFARSARGTMASTPATPRGDGWSEDKRNSSVTGPAHVQREQAQIVAQIIRSIVFPELEKEVNTGKNFASLRQIFNSIILASWYKKNLRASLLNQIYSDQAKINGIDLKDKTIKQQIYDRYLQAYKKGVFNYIKEEPAGASLPRKYFSGGVMAKVNLAMAAPDAARTVIRSLDDHAMVTMNVQFSDQSKSQVTNRDDGIDTAMLTKVDPETLKDFNVSPPKALLETAFDGISQSLWRDGLKKLAQLGVLAYPDDDGLILRIRVGGSLLYSGQSNSTVGQKINELLGILGLELKGFSSTSMHVEKYSKERGKAFEYSLWSTSMVPSTAVSAKRLEQDQWIVFEGKYRVPRALYSNNAMLSEQAGQLLGVLGAEDLDRVPLGQAFVWFDQLNALRMQYEHNIRGGGLSHNDGLVSDLGRIEGALHRVKERFYEPVSWKDYDPEVFEPLVEYNDLTWESQFTLQKIINLRGAIKRNAEQWAFILATLEKKLIFWSEVAQAEVPPLAFDIEKVIQELGEVDLNDAQLKAMILRYSFGLMSLTEILLYVKEHQGLDAIVIPSNNQQIFDKGIEVLIWHGLSLKRAMAWMYEYAQDINRSKARAADVLRRKLKDFYQEHNFVFYREIAALLMNKIDPENANPAMFSKSQRIITSTVVFSVLGLAGADVFAMTGGRDEFWNRFETYFNWLAGIGLVYGVGVFNKWISKRKQNELDRHHARNVAIDPDLGEFGSSEASGSTDAAMSAKDLNIYRNPTDKIKSFVNSNGGIDLKDASERTGVRKEGAGVVFDVDPAFIERVKRDGIEGLTPVILRIVPVSSLWPLLGLTAPTAIFNLTKETK